MINFQDRRNFDADNCWYSYSFLVPWVDQLISPTTVLPRALWFRLVWWHFPCSQSICHNTCNYMHLHKRVYRYYVHKSVAWSLNNVIFFLLHHVLFLSLQVHLEYRRPFRSPNSDREEEKKFPLSISQHKWLKAIKSSALQNRGLGKKGMVYIDYKFSFVQTIFFLYFSGIKER